MPNSTEPQLITASSPQYFETLHNQNTQANITYTKVYHTTMTSPHTTATTCTDAISHTHKFAPTSEQGHDVVANTNHTATHNTQPDTTLPSEHFCMFLRHLITPQIKQVCGSTATSATLSRCPSPQKPGKGWYVSGKLALPGQ